MTSPAALRHVAIIMDGNGRWAQRQGLPRVEGHRRGADAVREAIRAAMELRIPYLTLFCFSTENWKRPANELDFLMTLLQQYLQSEQQELIERGIRLNVIGRRGELSEDVRARIAEAEAATAGGANLTLTLAINYGARQEMVDAVRAICESVSGGFVAASEIDEDLIGRHLYTAELPDPDLLIRTSGECRISNFLLWQLSYAELVILDCHWPEFTGEHFRQAVEVYRGRERRYGGIAPAAAES